MDSKLCAPFPSEEGIELAQIHSLFIKIYSFTVLNYPNVFVSFQCIKFVFYNQCVSCDVISLGKESLYQSRSVSVCVCVYKWLRCEIIFF